MTRVVLIPILTHMATSSLPTGVKAGTRIVRVTDGRTGTVTRIIDRTGELGGLVEVRWDGQLRPSRSAGFEAGRDIRPA